MLNKNTANIQFPLSPEETKEEKLSPQNLKQSNGKYAIRNQILVTLAGAFMHMLSSSVFSLPGMALAAMRKEGSEDLQLTDLQSSLFGGAAMGGAILGCIVSSPMNVYFGQRKSLLLVHIVFIIFSVVVSFSGTFTMLVGATFIQGVTIGVASCSTMSYIVEVSHPDIRSRLSGITTFFRQFGFVYVVAVAGLGVGWRNIGLICNLSASIIPLVILPFMYDSPRWLASYGKNEDCARSLEFFRGNDYDTSSEYKEILNQVKNSKKTGILRECKILLRKPVRSRFLVLMVLSAALPMSGIISIASFILLILPQGEHGSDSYISAIVSISMRVFGVLTFLFCADRIENKKICLISLFGAGCGTFVLGLNFFLSSFHGISYVWVPMIATAVFLYCICLANPVLILIRGELLPTSARSTGLAIQNLLFHASAFVANFTFPHMVFSDQLYLIMFVYSGCTALMFFVYIFFIPKTNGKSLEELNSFRKTEQTRF